MAAVVISHWQVFHLESAPVSLLLCAVMFSAWFGGVGPGLLAIFTSVFAFYYSFLPPADALAAKPADIPRFLAFVVSTLFVGSLSVAQRRATESLRRTRDDLNETVQELKKTNEALGKSEAYLAEAQTLSHPGSFGWNVPTGEMFWSEETFGFSDTTER
jgi:K+-sensing histidine kinase KdpD